jgi:hypothetical protein
MDELLERERRQSPASAALGADLPSPQQSRLNTVWRQKVIGWYFTLIAALRRQHSEAEAGVNDGDNPFDRTSVHVTTALLDGYLESLPQERALRYKRDRPAYQLLATTSLLIGMRLAQHDRIKESRRREREANEAQQDAQQAFRGLKRAKTHMMNMNEATAGASAVATPARPAAGAPNIPNAAEILRISAAPKSMTEADVLSMVREMTGSRSFPRSRVLTAIDFLRALSQAGSLGPTELEEACRLADASLRGMSLVGSRPSVVACAAATLALARSRSRSPGFDMVSLRQQVYESIYGSQEDQTLMVAARMAESDIISTIQGVVPSSRNDVRPPLVPTTHLIPLEDD